MSKKKISDDAFVRQEEERIRNENRKEEAKQDDDGRVYATASLAIGILSFFVGAAIVFELIGIKFSNMGRKSERATQARIGKNLCVTALVMWLFIWAAVLCAVVVIAVAYFAHLAIKNW